MANLSRITSSKHPGGSHRRSTTPPLPASVSPGAASKSEPRNALGQKLIDGLIIAIVTLMPFHAFMSVTLGTRFGYQTIIQSWKEIVLILILLLVLVTRRLPEILGIISRRTNLAIIAFAFVAVSVSLLTGAFREPSFWFGVKTDLGFLLAFMLAQFAAPITQKRALRYFLIASTIVAIFGAIQATLLPRDFLTYFGYGPDTILPYGLVDPAVPATRVLSTLGGPNQLGSFLILPACLMLYEAVKKRRWVWLLPFAVVLFTIWNTFSRSAEIGLIAALGFLLLALSGRKLRIAAITISIAALTYLAAGGWRTFLDNQYLSYYLLHGRIENNQIQGSDAGRIENMKRGLAEAGRRPLGQGLGTAGPASEGRTDSLITENFYLQIVVETGIIGLLLFGLINILAAHTVWRTTTIPGVALVAALIGLTLNNLLLHTWADSSTALTFWTLAGLAAGGMTDEVA